MQGLLQLLPILMPQRNKRRKLLPGTDEHCGEELVEELGAAFDARIAAALTDSDATEEQKEEAAARDRQALRDGLSQGLASVFGKSAEGAVEGTKNVSEDVVPPGEVTPEDLEREYEAMSANMSRRKRYPKEAAALLASTLQKNRAMLRNLGVSLDVEEAQPTSEQLGNMEGVREALEVANKEVKEAKEVISGVEERSSQLLAAANILARTEGALGLI